MKPATGTHGPGQTAYPLPLAYVCLEEMLGDLFHCSSLKLDFSSLLQLEAQNISSHFVLVSEPEQITRLNCLQLFEMIYVHEICS